MTISLLLFLTLSQSLTPSLSPSWIGSDQTRESEKNEMRRKVKMCSSFFVGINCGTPPSPPSHFGVKTIFVWEKFVQSVHWWVVLVLPWYASWHSLNSFFFSFWMFSVLMIASFLRVNSPRSHCGSLLIDFLLFFGRRFQYQKMGITISKRWEDWGLIFFWLFLTPSLQRLFLPLCSLSNVSDWRPIWQLREHWQKCLRNAPCQSRF